MHAPRRPDPPALLIDALGTLLALDPPAPHLVGELRRLDTVVTEAQAARALAAEIAYYREHMGEGRDRGTVAALRCRCAGVLREALPGSPALSRVSVDELVGALVGSLRFRAHADARACLLRARGAGARVVVVSNWDVSLLDVLERTGLASLLDGVAVSAAVGAPKPAAEIFRSALALAAVDGARALHVGDSPSEDVVGARACGIEAVLIERGGARRAAGRSDVRVIAGLDELTWP